MIKSREAILILSKLRYISLIAVSTSSSFKFFIIALSISFRNCLVWFSEFSKFSSSSLRCTNRTEWLRNSANGVVLLRSSLLLFWLYKMEIIPLLKNWFLMFRLVYSSNPFSTYLFKYLLTLMLWRKLEFLRYLSRIWTLISSNSFLCQLFSKLRLALMSLITNRLLYR